MQCHPVIVRIVVQIPILYEIKNIMYEYIENKRPQIEPWGTPLDISKHSLCSFQIFTLSLRLYK